METGAGEATGEHSRCRQWGGGRSYIRGCKIVRENPMGSEGSNEAGKYSYASPAYAPQPEALLVVGHIYDGWEWQCISRDTNFRG